MGGSRKGGSRNSRFVLKPDVATASEVSILVRIPDFFSKRAQLANCCGKPPPGTPPFAISNAWTFATKFANDCECDGLVHSGPKHFCLAGYPADIRGSFSQALQTGKQAFQCRHPRPEGADVPDLVQKNFWSGRLRYPYVSQQGRKKYTPPPWRPPFFLFFRVCGSMVHTLLSGPMVHTLFPCFPRKMVYTIAFFAL